MGFMMAMLSYYGGERINELWATLALAWVEHGEARINLLGKPYPLSRGKGLLWLEGLQWVRVTLPIVALERWY